MEAPGARRWIAVTVLVLLGGGLRALNLATAFVHPDENHYAEDASWLVAPLPLRTGIHFLRDHPGVHYRLSPDTGALTPWPTTGPNLLGGHLPLHAYVAGLAIAVVRPTSRQSTTLVARGVDVVADTGSEVMKSRRSPTHHPARRVHDAAAHRGRELSIASFWVVRNGKGRTRKVTVGSGTIAVSAPV